MPKKNNFWSDTKRVFHVCTKGYEAKVINVVGYSILQVVLDLTALQLMLRVAILSARVGFNEASNQHEIAPTAENLKTLALFFFTTITGAVIAVYRNALGTFLLILTQIAMTLGVFSFFSKPMIESTLDSFWIERSENSFEANFFLDFLNCISTLLYCILYFIPTFLGIWFIYCTSMVMLVLLGYRVYEVQESVILPIIIKSDSSTIDTTSQSTPAETDYFSDSSSL